MARTAIVSILASRIAITARIIAPRTDRSSISLTARIDAKARNAAIIWESPTLGGDGDAGGGGIRVEWICGGLSGALSSPGPITSSTVAFFLAPLSPPVKAADLSIPWVFQPMLHLKVGRQTPKKAQLFRERNGIIFRLVKQRSREFIGLVDQGFIGHCWLSKSTPPDNRLMMGEFNARLPAAAALGTPRAALFVSAIPALV